MAKLATCSSGRPGKPIAVEAVNTTARLSLLSCGTVVPIVRFYAAGGIETDEPGEALACVLATPWRTWITVDLTSFDPASTH